MQDTMDLMSDMTTDMTGQVITPVSSQSEGPSGMTNPLAMNTISLQPPGMGPHTTNPVTSPLLHSLGEPSGGSNPGKWV